jgi:hypothetical protein
MSSDKDINGEKYFISSKPFSSHKTMIEELAHSTIKLVLSLIVNNEEDIIRELVDTGANSNIIS